MNKLKNDLGNFFNKLVQETVIKDKAPNINIRDDKNPRQIEIDFPFPIEGRPNQRSKKLVIRLSNEFLLDHKSCVTKKLPRARIIDIINTLDLFPNFNF